MLSRAWTTLRRCALLGGLLALGVACVAQQPAAKPAPVLPYRDLFESICGDLAPKRAAQVKQESAFNPRAVSAVGAKGLDQAMPKTWLWYQNMGWVPMGADPFDPEPAIRGGHRFMLWLEGRWWRRGKGADAAWDASLASFNAGEGNILNAERLADAAGIPGEYAWRLTLPLVTGDKHSKETLGYGPRIRRNLAWIEASGFFLPSPDGARGPGSGPVASPGKTNTARPVDPAAGIHLWRPW